MLSKLLLYIIQILLLKENYKQKWNARGQKASCEGSMKNVNKDILTGFV